MLFSIHLGETVQGVHASDQKTETASSDLSNQTGVAVTIYNVNLGLVKDQREIKLPKGTGELRFMDVASKIIPSSVHIKSLADSESLRILEQNYEYDLLNPEKLLDKYVGKEVKLYSKNNYTEREEVVAAKLLSNNGGPIFRIGDEITFGYPGRIIFPGVPENLISKPTLVWLLENTLPAQKVEATYLTDGINWRADYVVTLNEKDDRADLSGWVTIDNKSGTTYREAKLKLVAGDVNRVRDKKEYEDRMYRQGKLAAMPAAPQFKEEEFFEYHIYSLQRSSTIKENQTKQISLVTAEHVPVNKELVFYGAKFYYYNRQGEQTSNQKVGVFVRIENRKENNLGMPLPKGIIRVYKYDSEGGLQFIGEDSVDHTPKDEKIKIKLGDAFDVVGSRKQTDWQKLASDTYEAAFEISLRNHKKEDVTVKVIEPIPGDWKMLSASHEYKKSEAFTAEFNIPVPKDKEVKLNYRVRMRF
ncbi:MAG: DUF4139 domain-containing protein [Desulfobacterales bacterium CG07_land_8_20_14_0_80_52_14]|nr:MAG: DUF4139 domain-containing protein [Desulfobacterales bacterium CG07_land_8_20_14_0_80_52_14]